MAFWFFRTPLNCITRQLTIGHQNLSVALFGTILLLTFNGQSRVAPSYPQRTKRLSHGHEQSILYDERRLSNFGWDSPKSR